MRLSHFGFFLVAVWAFHACGTPPTSETVAPENWVSLFNGTNLDGWTEKMPGHDLNANHLDTWIVEDSMIRVNYAAYDSFGIKYSHLYYKQPYSHYKLRFEYRFTGEQVPGGASWNVRNSGVMLHSQSAASNAYGQHFPVSVEMQLLGGLDDGKERTTGNVCTPGTAVVRGDSVDYTHCISSSSKTYHGDDWIRAEAVVFGGEAMHFLIEGDTVLSFREPQIGGPYDHLTRWGVPDTLVPAWAARDGEVLTSGYIALQAESHPIDFRHIKILSLD